MAAATSVPGNPNLDRTPVINLGYQVIKSQGWLAGICRLRNQHGIDVQ
jgi:hypothetical protein